MEPNGNPFGNPVQMRAEAKLVWIMPSAAMVHLHNKPCEPMSQAERRDITITAKIEIIWDIFHWT